MAAVLATLFLAGHLPFLASSLEDVDSANFALGVHDFDPGRHRPHPPGYPIYIAAARAASAVMSVPHALAIWGVLCGALAAFALLRLFACLDAIDANRVDSDLGRGRRWESWLAPPAAAMLVSMTAPLVWMTAARPMSDTLGFAAALAAQALLVTALVRQSRMRDSASGLIDPVAAADSGRLILFGAFACALSIGVRSQATWLTVPLLVFVIASRGRRESITALMGSAVCFTSGILLWLVPLIMASGGPSKYLAAFAVQAGEDWSGVDLLATHPTARKLAFALYETFVLHWAGIGWVMLAAASAGFVVMMLRRRRGLLVLLLAFAPYALFHLGFQETFTTRYALPLVPPVAYLAVRGFLLLGRVAGRGAIVVVSCAALALTAPVTASYSRVGSPTTRAIADLTRESSKTPGVMLGMHHAFARPVEAAAPELPAWHALPTPPKHEWLSLVKAWTGGDRRPVWFLSDPHRTDLALIDPEARTIRADYAWPFATPIFLGGIRPDQLQWVVIRQPGWFAGEGWHLTPETAGVARADHRGLEYGPIVAWVKRRDGEATMMIGGRHLGAEHGPPVVLKATIDGRDLGHWPVGGGDFFLAFIPLPAGSLAGGPPYARLEIQSGVDGTDRNGIVAVEQFDVQQQPAVMRGYSRGWHEPEYNPKTGQTWRWASEQAVVQVSTTDADLELQLSGESPLNYFTGPSSVTVKAGRRTLFSQSVSADFAWSIRMPAEALKQSSGEITIESNQSYRPADRGQNADRRSLALRIYSVTLKQASAQDTAANSRTAPATLVAPAPPR